MRFPDISLQGHSHIGRGQNVNVAVLVSVSAMPTARYRNQSVQAFCQALPFKCIEPSTIFAEQANKGIRRHYCIKRSLGRHSSTDPRSQILADDLYVIVELKL